MAILLEAEAVEQGHAGAPGEAARVARIAELARLNAGLDGVLSQSIVAFVGERDRRAVEERARAGRLVQDSEARYRSLFDSMDEGFCIVEVLFEAERPVDYVFLQVNHAFERHTGLAHAIGKRVREMLPGHEQYWFEIYGRVARTGEPARFENPAQALGRFYDVYAFRVGEPEQCHVAVLFNDITDRRRAEEAVRTSEETSRICMRCFDPSPL
jgi:PAS domain S-box-containing protein